MASDDEPIYCVCRQPYDETRFMIECDKCKDWFHGSCVGVQEHQAADIEIYHCPQCTSKYGPLVLKHRRNWHRHDYSEDGAKLKRSAVQTGTVIFIKELKSRSFSSADEIPIRRLHGSQLTPQYVEQEGFDVPILCEKKDGLNMTLPSPSISIHEIEQLVGPMREIDVIDVARQDDIKMTMREWVEYYSSPNREKILNVISLEFSNTALSEYVVPPKIVRQLSWARNVWPEQLPEEVTLPRPEVQKYCLMGVKDGFTDFHIDFGGTSVWYHVLRGEKVFYLIRPSQTNLTLYERWLSSSNQSELFFGDQAEKCYQIVVKEGHTLFIPTGWIHAVLTPLDSLVFGGNFLHNFNIRLQLQCYEIERSVKTPEKYLFPSYEIINWYAAKHMLDNLQEYSEDGKSPPLYLLDGAKAMADSLKTWTQKKDLTSKTIFVKVGKQDAADYIQYGKLLKDLQKEVKKLSALEKTVSPKKQDNKRKRGDKSPQKTPQKMQVLDVLEQHTKQTLKLAQKERKENIYTFKDEDDMPTSLKVRIPKPGAYVAELDTNFTPSAGSGSSKKSAEVKVKEEKSETRVKEEKKVEVELEQDKSGTKKKSSGKKSKKELKKEKKEASRKLLLDDVVKKEEEVKVEKTAPIAAVKEVPPCLKFKLSNGKMVSTDKKMKRRKNQFLLLGADLSSSTVPPTEDVKSEKVVSPNAKSPQKSTKAEKPKKQDVSDTGPSKSKDKSGPAEKNSSKSETGKVTVKSKDSKQSKSTTQESKKSRKTRKESTKPSTPGDSDSDIDQLVVDENPKPVRTAKTTSTMKPASLKLKLPAESAKDNPEGGEPQSEGEAIRGGLNGSISDILTASGYATDQTFNDTSGMRDAIAGMLTMSRMGDPSSSPATLPAPAGGSTRGKPAADEEEELMADCYRDSEFVYPSFDLSDDEEDSIHRSKKKAEKDDNWNPKARIDQKLMRVEREHRVGVQKESVASTLASTAAKLAEAPPDRKLPKKLIKVVRSPPAEVEPEPGPSTVLTEPVNAFRPGIKRPIDPSLAGTSSQQVKDKKPKKGMATVKQRLGKLLKIKKMVY